MKSSRRPAPHWAPSRTRRQGSRGPASGEISWPGEIEAGGNRYTAERFLIATGARKRIPEIDGLKEAGFLTFRDAIDLTELPESIFILGGGPVGCEFAELFAASDRASYLTDHNERLVHPEEPEAGELLGRELAKGGVKLLLDSEVSRVARRGNKLRVMLEQEGATKDRWSTKSSSPAARFPMSRSASTLPVWITMRRASKSMTNADQLSLRLRCGDVAGPYRFTHAASYQGQVAAANMFGPEQKRKVDYRAMPRCVFTRPRFAASA